VGLADVVDEYSDIFAGENRGQGIIGSLIVLGKVDRVESSRNIRVFRRDFSGSCIQ